ncbi:MAG: hypothetical protein ACYTHN_09840, partial [Planctomycetota bacterium]
ALARVFIPEPPKPAIQRIETEISLIHAQGDEKSGLVGPKKRGLWGISQGPDGLASIPTTIAV